MPTNITKPSVTVSVMDVVSIKPEHYLKYYPCVTMSPRQMGKSITHHHLMKMLMALVRQNNTHFSLMMVDKTYLYSNRYPPITKSLDNYCYHTSQRFIQALLPHLF